MMAKWWRRHNKSSVTACNFRRIEALGNTSRIVVLHTRTREYSRRAQDRPRLGRDESRKRINNGEQTNKKTPAGQGRWRAYVICNGLDGQHCGAVIMMQNSHCTPDRHRSQGQGTDAPNLTVKVLLGTPVQRRSWLQSARLMGWIALGLLG